MTSKLDEAGVPEGVESLVMLSVTKHGKRYEQFTTVRRVGNKIKTVGDIRVDVTEHFEAYLDL